MFSQLSLDEFKSFATKHEKVAVHLEIVGDQITPVSIFQALGNLMQGSALLETSLKEKQNSRYSYLCFNPLLEIQAHGNKVTIKDGITEQQLQTDIIDILRNLQKTMHAVSAKDLPGFAGGMVGYVSYDSIRLFENIPDRHANHQNIPDVFFKFYRDHICFDHQTGKIVLITIASRGEDIGQSYSAALQHLHMIKNRIFTSLYQISDNTIQLDNIVNKHAVTNDLDDQTYMQMVTKAKSYIKKGDIFQVVLSRQFKQKYNASSFTIYRALRLCSPAPYMFYLDNSDFTIVGASPEKLVTVKDNLMEVCPLAGTRKRTHDAQEESIMQDLLQDAKEAAEHMMLVDLARNDIGRIAEANTINIPELKQIKKFSHVMHMSSTVQGKLQKQYDAFDAIAANFPAGTLSGAPKIRAMEIIDELENSRRGIYGGAICAIDNRGNLESCIAIRMAVLKQGIATIRTGAGIVYDSDPQKEAEETRQKAQSVLSAIALAEEGLS